MYKYNCLFRVYHSILPLYNFLLSVKGPKVFRLYNILMFFLDSIHVV